MIRIINGPPVQAEQIAAGFKESPEYKKVENTNIFNLCRYINRVHGAFYDTTEEEAAELVKACL